jgi:hypothetical protein
MAKVSNSEVRKFHAKTKKKNPGVHSKKNSSSSKTSKNYRKAYVGQGR